MYDAQTKKKHVDYLDKAIKDKELVKQAVKKIENNEVASYQENLAYDSNSKFLSCVNKNNSVLVNPAEQ